MIFKHALSNEKIIKLLNFKRDFCLAVSAYTEKRVERLVFFLLFASYYSTKIRIFIDNCLWKCEILWSNYWQTVKKNKAVQPSSQIINFFVNEFWIKSKSSAQQAYKHYLKNTKFPAQQSRETPPEECKFPNPPPPPSKQI